MKYAKFVSILLLVSFLSGCVFDDPKYINLKSKPNLYYYSNEVYNKLQNSVPFTLQVFDTNYYEYYDVNTEDTDILVSFLGSLNNDNYVESLEIDEEKARYKLIVSFGDNEKDKFVINVYNHSYITLFPWDGNLEEDMIVMDNVPLYDNLYSFCTYVINKAHSHTNN